MRRLILVILGILVTSTQTNGFASDVGAVVAPMKTEAEECRYLLNLCTREASLRAKFDKAVGSEGALAAGNAWELVAADLASAARAIRNKHAKRPACFAKCAALKDAPAFE
jgi:hypothetical protein